MPVRRRATLLVLLFVIAAALLIGASTPALASFLAPHTSGCGGG